MKALELFAGIGGIALAEQMAGIEVAGLCEYAEFPRQILRKHWPNVPLYKDVTKLDGNELKQSGIDPRTIDIISGGFPCQPFSIAGKRHGTEDDRDLWPEMFRIIDELRPTWVVGENVANFANMELDRTLANLEGIGYQTRTFVLPAEAVGAFHRRYRTFIVAHAGGQRWDRVAEGARQQRHSKPTQNTLRDQSRAWDRDQTFDLLSAGKRAIDDGSRVILRNDDGISSGLDRLKALGNAVVPQQILPIFQTIVEVTEHD
jgi:DNA (cytosine-5)-methyltransferase 1